MGICLRKALPKDYPLLAIDCVSADDGDYLDIGESVGNGKAVPVAIKKLVFRFKIKKRKNYEIKNNALRRNILL